MLDSGVGYYWYRKIYVFILTPSLLLQDSYTGPSTGFNYLSDMVTYITEYENQYDNDCSDVFNYSDELRCQNTAGHCSEISDFGPVLVGTSDPFSQLNFNKNSVNISSKNIPKDSYELTIKRGVWIKLNSESWPLYCDQLSKICILLIIYYGHKYPAIRLQKSIKNSAAGIEYPRLNIINVGGNKPSNKLNIGGNEPEIEPGNGPRINSEISLMSNNQPGMGSDNKTSVESHGNVQRIQPTIIFKLISGCFICSIYLFFLTLILRYLTF